MAGNEHCALCDEHGAEYSDQSISDYDLGKIQGSTVGHAKGWDDAIAAAAEIAENNNGWPTAGRFIAKEIRKLK